MTTNSLIKCAIEWQNARKALKESTIEDKELHKIFSNTERDLAIEVRDWLQANEQ